MSNMTDETDEYLELFLTWASGGEHPDVTIWLAQRSLSTMRMKNGLLVTGSRSQIERTFGVTLAGRQPPVDLPVPTELAPHVASITLPRPRSYHR